MLYYFAPMEGITDSVYRRVHHAHFGGVDRYYMPFFSPTMHRCLTPRETRELPAADSVAFRAVPQIMTRNPEDFLWAARQCMDRGYDEVNLNMGCPSGTVVSKGKGAGMLRDLDALARFFDQVFADAPLPVSVKTRLGLTGPEEFPAVLEILNRYPIHELTLHPRVRKAFYAGDVHMDSFRYCLQNAAMPVCYNGNLCSKADIERFCREFPQADRIMLGRGLVGDPGMLTPGGSTAEALEAFMAQLTEEYIAAFGSARNAMFRLKDNWHLMLRRFEGSEQLGKKLKKATDLAEFQAITAQIFHTLPLAPALQPDW